VDVTAIAQIRRSFTNQYPLGDLLAIRLPVLCLLLVPLFAPQLFPTSRLLSLALTATIYVMVANGMHIIFSYTGQLSLAQTTLWGVGAYTAALLIGHYDPPTLLVLPAAALVAAGGAVLIGIPAFRTAGFSFAIITLAFAEIARLVATNWTSLTNGTTGLTITHAPSGLGPIDFNPNTDLTNFYYLSLSFAYLSLVAVWAIARSPLGRNFIAIRENETLARSAGINVYLYKLIAFALSGAFAGVAGVFYVYNSTHVEPGPLSPFLAFASIQFLLMILIGGRFSMLGPAIGATVVLFGPELINTIFGNVLTTSRTQIIFGCTLALSVISAPTGIAGQARLGFANFVAVLRHSREEGRSWPASALIAFGRSFIPVPVRYDTDAADTDL
jgi:branched-chain amino acid transport system permease protein